MSLPRRGTPPRAAGWLWLFGIALLGVIAVGALSTSQPPNRAQPTNVVPTHPVPTYAIPGEARGLANASAEEVASNALAQTIRRVGIVSGQPEVVLVRRVRGDELDALGILDSPLMLTTEEPPLALVILRGDFDVRNMFPGFQHLENPRRQYIGYLYDLWAGAPMGYFSSETGSEFREVLNDPSIPDQRPASVRTHIAVAAANLTAG